MINLKLLNSKQKEAVLTNDNKVFVVAGAGCGKTRVLTYRIAHLIDEGISQKDIYGFTFTNRAANEMKDRLNELLGYESNVNLSTFHSFGYKLIKKYYKELGFEEDIKIIDDDDKKKIINRIIEEEKIPIVDIDILKNISAIKSFSKINSNNLLNRLYTLKIFYKYQLMLKKSCIMDYDDLLFYSYKLLSKEITILDSLFKNSYVLVDECQDINNIQYKLIKLLASKSNHIFMVGDEDQCIYSFRGSNKDCIHDFIDNEKATVIKLEQNYRSCKNILNAANSLIKENHGRVEKELYTEYEDKNYKIIISNLENDFFESLYISDLVESLLNKGYRHKDITILYRNNFLSIPIEKEFLRKKIPFYIFGKTQFFQKKEIKTLLSYLRFIVNPNDDVAFLDIINTPRRGIGETTINKIKEFSKNNNISYYKTLLSSDIFENNNEISSFLSFMSVFLNIEYEIIPLELIKELLKSINYYDYLRKETNSKERISNVYTLLEMFKEVEVKDSFKKTISEFINNLYLENERKEANKDYIKMMTIHQAKGLEYKIVIVVGCNDGIIPCSHESIDIIEEERRLFYVAITRAKERLYLLSSNRRLVNGQYRNYEISPFILEINTDIINFN